jgi:hypothetical protein
MFIIRLIINFFKKLKRRALIAKAYVELQKSYKKQLIARRLLRSQVNQFLKDFFGIDAKSKYIPKDYKNKEEVRVAVIEKFGFRMDQLNVNYTDLFN